MRICSLIMRVSLVAMIGLCPLAAQAQPTIEILKVEPDIRPQNAQLVNVVVGGMTKEISFLAKVTPDDATIQWTRTPSVGEFDGDTTGRACYYLVPQSLIGEAQEVTITVTATDAQGRSFDVTIPFLLTLPPNTPTPIPTVAPTATPTRMPTMTPMPRPTVTPQPTVTPTARPTARPTIAPTPKPTATPKPLTPRPAPTSTPKPPNTPLPENTAAQIPSEIVCQQSDRSLDDILGKSLPEALAQYKALKDQENQKLNVNAPLITTIEIIVCDLNEIVRILKESNATVHDPAIDQRIEKTEETRVKYYQEWQQRRGN